MDNSRFRIEVYCKIKDHRGEVILNRLKKLGFSLQSVILTDNYLINVKLSGDDILKIARSLINPVTQGFSINKPYAPADFNYAIEIGFLPGVTDNAANTLRESVEDLLRLELDPDTSVFTSLTYFLRADITHDQALSAGSELYNPLIQRIKILSKKEFYDKGGMGMDAPVVHIAESPDADKVTLNISDDGLLKLGKNGIPNPDGTRRGPLALDIPSLNVIKHYFNDVEKREPTDVELESIAQTWSEHCKHTIFAARIDEIEEGIFKRYIREATVRIRREKGADDFCVSVFEDNSGGIEFDENYVISDKVETHNSPSALDPFGGSITGIVGVNRDTIGFGMGARPIANRYGFCFADPSDEKPLYREKNADSRLLSPRRIMEGVIRGVNVGGNCSGIPTPQGFVYFDGRYKGKPLVFVGTVGLLPRDLNGVPSTQKKALPGDYIVMLGGRVGRDGIHGATFSSEALSSGSPATAVQIGDPITQKKFSDAIVKEARDRALYNSITDNGAGGLSCSVAEMAKESGGFEVELDRVPLKYPGLSPWQIWISESQERMTVAVPPEKCDEFIELMRSRGVLATVIGVFNNSSRGLVRYNGKAVLDLDMHFLHEGLPRKNLQTRRTEISRKYSEFPEPENQTAVCLGMIGRLNTASFEFISTQYDHEVQGNSVIKPLQGRGRINGPASVIRPLMGSKKGVVLSQGLYPSYSDIDAYWMAACSIDTAIRNALSAGGSLKKLALLDNFCWCDSDNPERLGQLKDAARGCYDFAVAYGTPFISGKDSMYNDFNGYDENFERIKISVPPTLLISSIGIVDDVEKCQSIDLKFPGDIIYVLGATCGNMGGSEYLAYMGEALSGKKYTGGNIPEFDASENRRLYAAFETAVARELVSSSISIERGGLGVALLKSAMAGMLGLSVDLNSVPSGGMLRDDYKLYSESQGRLLVSVDPEKAMAFEEIFKGFPCAKIGKALPEPRIEVKGKGDKIIIAATIEECLNSYKGKFRDFN